MKKSDENSSAFREKRNKIKHLQFLFFCYRTDVLSLWVFIFYFQEKFHFSRGPFNEI